MTLNSQTFGYHQGTSVLVLIQGGKAQATLPDKPLQIFSFSVIFKSSDLHCSVLKAFMQIQVVFLSESDFKLFSHTLFFCY